MRSSWETRVRRGAHLLQMWTTERQTFLGRSVKQMGSAHRGTLPRSLVIGMYGDLPRRRVHDA